MPALAGEADLGGAPAPVRPQLEDASCSGHKRAWTCARGQLLTLGGRDLASASAVVFLGAAGDDDDVRVALGARAAAAGELIVVVPRRARSGPLALVGALGGESRSERALTVLARADHGAGLGALLAGGRRQALVAYRVDGAAPAGAAIEAVRTADGAVVRRWPIEGEQGERELRWDGYAGDVQVRTGTYLLRLDEQAAGVATILPGSDTQLRVIEALFPIRAKHVLARTPTQRFGGGRGHQGNDVFARCGAPLAAQSKGVVHAAGFHGAAGNHVVVNTPDGGSYAYMHMRDPALVRKGERVHAGERLGVVGQTGRASECHLHFELWSAPGWYQGGSPLDPGPSLARWDAWS